MRAKKNNNLTQMIAAAIAGGAYNFGIEAASKRIEFVSKNYMAVKASGAGVLGAALVYFGKDEHMKAAGYGLLGVAGATGASKVATMITSDSTMQGIDTKKRAEIIARAKALREKGIMLPPAGGSSGNTNQVIPQFDPYATIAFSDVIYK
jgi:hypothetical protein